MYPQVFGKYVLERELARGGMARVLLATLRGAGGFEKRLVVKQIRDDLALDEEFISRFVEEAKTTVSLSHPNIVPVYELGVEQGTYFLSMELVEGASLSELLDPLRRGKVPLTPEQGAYVGAEVCRALDYAHRRMKVVHRDITPRNVMVDEEGQIKLIDFGIAARAEHGGDKRVFGSPGHMPPEQMEGRELGPPTDLFAVGVLLMELWSGKAPFRRKTVEEAAAAMREPHPKPSDIDPRLAPLDEIVGRTLALAGEDRPQTADELGRVLRRFLTDVDLGDIARSLGDRAHQARQAAVDRADAETVHSLRPREPSHAEMATKTFAAREEVLTDTPPSTRRLDSEKPPSGSSEAAPRSEPRVETVATRPLETPVRDFAPTGRERPSDRRSGGTLAAVVAVVTLGGGALLYFQRPQPSTEPRVAKTAEAASAPAGPTPSAPAPSASVTVSAAVPTAAKPPRPVESVVEAPLERPPTERTTGRITAFCDPETRVMVDGVQRGRCPLKDLLVEAGPHEVRFTFEPTGESRGERVHVVKDKRVTLRADFTGSSPSIRVE